MDNKLDLAWTQYSEALKEFSQQADHLSRAARTALESAKRGDHSVIESRLAEAEISLESLKRTQTELSTKISQFGATAVTPSEVVTIVENFARIAFPDTAIFQIQNHLVVFPLVANFSSTNKGHMVQIGDEQLLSSRPNAIIEFIRTEFKRSFNAPQFVKSLNRAFEYLARGNRDVAVSLEEVRQVLSVSRESLNSYSVESFTHDLQRLYTTTNLESSGMRVELLSAAAARHQFPIYLANGNFINVAQIQVKALEKKGSEKNESAN